MRPAPVGAAQALKSRDSGVKLVGFDASPSLEADLRAGVIDSLLVQNPFKMGCESALAAMKKIRGEPVEKIQSIPPRLVTQQNLDDRDVQEQINPDLKTYLSAEHRSMFRLISDVRLLRRGAMLGG